MGSLFNAALKNWESASQEGAVAITLFDAGLQQFFGAKKVWNQRRITLDALGMETAYTNFEERTRDEEATGALKAERALVRLQAALQSLTECVSVMWDSVSEIRGKVRAISDGEGEERWRPVAQYAEILSACADMHNKDLQLKLAVGQALTLNSSVAEAKAMGIAWSACVDIREDFKQKVLEAIAEEANVSGAAGTGGGGAKGAQSGKSKKKKSKKPSEEASS
mmetsp:Transcript_9263/g.18500  ORF Transcript_9263/g.18500 Transcript_9263/m.18500 type:complete len:223 (+) Transcript_9263:186-854(+)|eukprot:CAMPEP_0181314582 /NCGR_PEP_ID=MMETSP1101-20121128/14900_1 /TAXON_ID=46948 /ORGANISM="Rhodomonas abbreviata, Strain Caron Lab Isolate" /LENGTH=222 /DNA_ID=CAMNT_0023421695 /DNA_START=184 /DNA_END=852 /DNA_ORIENTATION=+